MCIKELLRPTKNPLAKRGFYERILNSVFEPLKLGCLKMVLPDGTEVIYGQGQEIEADLRVVHPDFFKKCILYGDVGFGESYVDGDWETTDIAKVIEWMILNVENHPTLMADKKRSSPVNFLSWINRLQHILRDNTIHGSRRNIEDHYDLSNDFFGLFLDPTMTYSSAYFKNNRESLEEAQAQKYEALCRKLQIHSKDHVLEIGSGWGGFAIHAAKNFGCHVTTITISQKQFEYAKRKIKEAGLSHRIEIHLQDYRSTKGLYSKIVSIEMIEAVGHKHLKTFFQQCHQLLDRNGLLGLQMILSPDHRYDAFRTNVDWIQKHIFPGSLLPSMNTIQQSLRQTGTMTLLDYEDITPSYVKTLSLWKDRFNENAGKVRALGFDDSFVRKWNYYKAYCKAAFNMRNISVAQAVFTRPNNLSLSYEI